VALKIACPATTVTCAGKVSLKGATGRRTSLGAKAFTPEERADLRARLARLDARAPDGPWTRATLAIIDEHPGTRAAELAASLGRERLPFKADVRKLKALGLTESLERGYRISPRGRAFLDGESPPAPT